MCNTNRNEKCWTRFIKDESTPTIPNTGFSVEIGIDNERGATPASLSAHPTYSQGN